jgi:hypothetical protein
MPYRGPVAVALSALWWGIYFGVFGAVIGATVAQLTVGRWASRRPTPHEVGQRAIRAAHWEQCVASRDFAARPPAETQVVIEVLLVEVSELHARVQALEQRLEDVHC